mgnify:CR=1 FL=1
MRRPIGWLVIALGALALLLAPLNVDTARAEKRAPKVIELEEMVIEGKVAKPQVFYILTRRDVRYEGLRMDESFLSRIVDSVRQNPF